MRPIPIQFLWNVSDVEINFRQNVFFSESDFSEGISSWLGYLFKSQFLIKIFLSKNQILT